MHSRAQPHAVPFDPLQGTASPALNALLEAPGFEGPVVLLAVGARAQQTGWAARTAVFIAEACGVRGATVVLADLSLQKPVLHAEVGLDNEEGLSDVFLFGASLEHITLPVKDRSFSLIPASPFTPDTSDMLRDERWGAVFEALAAAQSKLILFLPVNVDGASAFSDRVGHTVILADAAELETVHAKLAPDADVIGVLIPPGSKAPAPMQVAARAADVDPNPAMARLDDEQFERIRIPKDGARDALIADLRSRQRAALMAPPPVMRPLAHEATEVPVARAPLRPTNRPLERMAPPLFTIRPVRPTPRPTGRWWFWAFLLVVLAGAGGAGWYIWGKSSQASERQANASKRRAATVTTLPVRPAPAQAAPAFVSAPGPLRYSVAIASYRVFDRAREQVQVLHKGDARMAFYISPIAVQGAVFYRVMAGPVADSMTALTLRDTLLARRIKTGTSPWDVLSTPLAFLLGEYSRAGEAAKRQQEAEAKGIPSYVVETAGPDGSPQFKLYAGAYTGPGDAEFMRPILKRAGLPDHLVERTGSIRS